MARKSRNTSGQVRDLRDATDSFVGGGEWGGSRYVVCEEEMKGKKRARGERREPKLR